MNSLNTIDGSPPVATATRDEARRRSGGRRVLKTTAAMVAVLVATASSGAAPASATPISTPYFSADSEVICDPTFNTVRINIRNDWVDPAYRGMWVQHRTYIESIDLVTMVKTGSWSHWSNSVQLWNNFQTLAQAVGSSDNVWYSVYTQVRYWTGTNWSTPVGNSATKYMVGVLSNGQRGTYNNGHCYT
jgi:hypothetical protein